MRIIAIMPGRYNPPHKGHKAVYDKLASEFGAENTYVVTSDKQDPVKSPFPFAEKKALWETLGVPSAQIVQIKNPYIPVEVTSSLDPENTAIVFALGKKDAGRFTFKPKKDGSPSYMQPYNSKELKPLSQFGYIIEAPTVTFPVAGQQITGATEIRDMYASASDEVRNQILKDLYGKAPASVRSLFDRRLASTQTESLIREFIEYINKF